MTTVKGNYAAMTLAALVREWRDAINAIDALTLEQRRQNLEPLERLMAAHNALLKYASEEME